MESASVVFDSFVSNLFTPYESNLLKRIGDLINTPDTKYVAVKYKDSTYSISDKKGINFYLDENSPIKDELLELLETRLNAIALKEDVLKAALLQAHEITKAFINKSNYRECAAIHSLIYFKDMQPQEDIPALVAFDSYAYNTILDDPEGRFKEFKEALPINEDLKQKLQNFYDTISSLNFIAGM